MLLSTSFNFLSPIFGVTVDRWNAHFRCFWGNFWSVRSLFLILNVFGLKCWTKHGTSPLVHVREVECLTGREPTNTKRSILVNSFCAVLLLSSAFGAIKFWSSFQTHWSTNLLMCTDSHAQNFVLSFPISNGPFLNWEGREFAGLGMLIVEGTPKVFIYLGFSCSKG